MQNHHTKRLFIAASILADLSLRTLVEKLRHSLSYERINWVKPDNMHLTFKFLGNTPQDKILPITRELQSVANHHKPIAYYLNKCGIFGSKYNPRVIWLGADSHPESIISLATDIIDSMHKLGFERDRQNFVPHLTIGRIKLLSDKHRFQQLIQSIEQADYQQLQLNEFRLYESVLKPTGPEYTIIERFPLTK